MIVYIPFVRDSQNYVNAAMEVSIAANDTSFGYLCDWQYAERRYQNTAVTDSTAEEYAVFFMQFDRSVFGHTKFKVADSLLFSNYRKSPDEEFRQVNLISSTRSTQGRSETYTVTICEDVIICGGADYCRRRGACDWVQCVSSPPVCFRGEFCIEWTYGGGDTGNNGGTGNGGTGTGGDGGTGGGGSGSTTTPPICPGATTGNRGATYVNCTPGWTPIYDNPPTPPEPIDSILKRYSTKINTIADSIFAISQNNNEEWGFIIVENAAGEIYAKACTTNHDAGQVRLDRSLSNGERIIAELHTHPEVGPNPLSRSAPSGSDFKTLKINSRYPYTSFIDCGNVRYAIVVENVNLSRTFFQKPENRIDFLTANQDSIALTKPNWSTDWQNATEVSILELIGSSAISGIGVYKSDTTKTTFIKLN